MNSSTLCLGADIHLDQITLRAVDKSDGHEVIQRFHVTNNLPGAESAVSTIAQAATQLRYTRIEVGWEIQRSKQGIYLALQHRYKKSGRFLPPS